MQVVAFTPSGGSVRSANTDPSGHYTLPNLAPGNYKVRFLDSPYITEWWNDKANQSSADLVAVAEGTDTPNTDAALVLGGSISGTVTDQATGLPLQSIQVSANTPAGGRLGEVWTDSSGHYTIGGLPAGTYDIYFWHWTYAPEWWDNQSDQGSADPVVVALGVDTPNIDATLGVGGTISGTVTDQATGLPLQNVWVGAYPPAGGWVRDARTDSSGRYTIVGLTAGTYKVEFWDAVHMTEWWNDQADQGSADPVAVTQGTDTPNIDAALAIGGSISGTVTDEATGLPLQGVNVAAFTPAGGWVQSDATDSAGHYTVGGLHTGDYKVQFWHSSYVAEWWDDKTNFGAANTVAVVQGADTPGINAALAVGGSISGTVTDEATGLPLQGVNVAAFSPTGGWVNSASTGADGTYTIGGLPTGDYKIRFWSSTYVAEWWDDKPSDTAANLAGVVNGKDTANIDRGARVGWLDLGDGDRGGYRHPT